MELARGACGIETSKGSGQDAILEDFEPSEAVVIALHPFVVCAERADVGARSGRKSGEGRRRRRAVRRAVARCRAECLDMRSSQTVACAGANSLGSKSCYLNNVVVHVPKREESRAPSEGVALTQTAGRAVQRSCVCEAAPEPEAEMLCDACGGSDGAIMMAITAQDQKLEACLRLQLWWRLRRAKAGGGHATSIEAGWTGKRAKRLGRLEAHVRFLQWFVRARARLLEMGCRSKMAVVIALRLAVRRRVTRCAGGRNLASDAEFEEMRMEADRMLGWYSQYVAMLRKWLHRATPSVLHTFCGGGGATEGTNNAGGSGHGVDLHDMPEYRRRFGDENFTQGDATSWELVRRLQKTHGLLGAMAGPSCKWYSKARVKGESREPPQIEIVRDLLSALFEFWSIENVLGAKEHMSKNSVVLTGFYFGLKVSRGRLFETSFPMVLDAVVLEKARALERRSCLGARRRWRSFDEFGRPVVGACCRGNIFSVTGESPSRAHGTLEQCAEAMGIDVGHMEYATLAQAIPPSYSHLVFSQMCMRMASRWFGAPIISYDDRVRRPHWAQQQMAMWLRGAGGESPSLGLQIVQAVREQSQGGSHEYEGSGAEVPGRRVILDTRAVRSKSEPLPSSERARLVEVRELNYTFAGGYTRQWVSQDLDGRLEDSGCAAPFGARPQVSELVGHNTLVEVRPSELGKAVSLFREALASTVEGTRITAIVRPQEAALLRTAGFSYLPCLLEVGGEDALASHGLVAMCAGRRKWASAECKLDHEAIREYMDPRDRGGSEFDAERKQAAAWREMPWLPELWQDVGLPPFFEDGMTRGFEVDLVAEPGNFEVPQYNWPSGEALMECIAETDRALAVGAMEFVPDSEVATVRENNVVHPWTVAMKPKPRACQDYSLGTNRTARSKPFELPTVWDAAKVVGPDSHFCAYDLRDGFWSTPVRESSRNRLVMRHPATGRLIRCARFPFGYALSPHIFCGLTEAIGQLLRKRLAGRGVHVYVYVDDVLLVGENESAAREGGMEFERLLEELGVEWAPHKQRGPCKCINFLGMMLCNLPGQQVVALTESRQRRLREMINSWLEKRPSGARATADAAPKELASLLGHLVFASQCVPGGRTYMQAMLSSFRGCEVDWRRGAVRFARGSEWRRVPLSEGFWRDLDWWAAHLERRNCVPMKRRHNGDAMLAGTDASDWGTGQLIWLDGQREEVSLKFTLAEKRRSINWRELLGIYRVVQTWGHRLKGSTLLIETDNTAAHGASRKGASGSEDMQELIRRMYELAEEHDINLRFVHTPGVLLTRPDQTSRGDPIEEARVRLSREEASRIERGYGPFSEVLGSERRLFERRAASGDAARVCMHPAHTTVGSAMRRLGERLCETDGSSVSGVIVVPHDESAAWWSMTKHFDVVGRWPAGSRHLEMNQLGEWRVVPSQRPSLILTFPRSLGGVIKPLWRGEQGVESDADYLIVMSGSFFYQEPEKPGGDGVLYVAWGPFDPAGNKAKRVEDGSPCVAGAELRRVATKGGRRGRVERYQLDRRPHRESGSFANTGGAWQVDPKLCWATGSLARITHSSASAGVEDGRMRVTTGKAKLEDIIVEFDVRRMEQEIAAAKRSAGYGKRVAAATDMREAELEAPQNVNEIFARRSTRSSGVEVVGGVAADVDFERQLRREARGRSNEGGQVMAGALEAEASRTGLGGRLVTPAPLVAQEGQRLEECEEVAALAEQLQRQSLQPGGGLEGELADARAAADLVASIRKPARDVTGATDTNPAPPAQMDPNRPQPCRYAYMKCAGCGYDIGWGQPMVPAGRSMAHAEGTCKAVAEEQLLKDIADAKGQRAESKGDDASSVKRATQFAHRLSDDRIGLVMNCMEGKCGESKEDRTFCVRKCGRGVHVTSCCHISKGKKDLGLVICAHCRLEDIVGIGCRPEQEVLKSMVKAMIVELSSGADSTAKGYSEFIRLEKEWQLSMVVGEMRAEDVRLPHTNIEAFYHFVIWLATDGGRARSLGNILRAAGSYCVKLELTDWTKHGRIKNLIKELVLSTGVVSTPCTHVTRMLVAILLEETLPARCNQAFSEKQKRNALALRMIEFFIAKARVTIDLELVGGLRIGETTGAKHGLTANHVVIQTLSNPSAAEPWQQELGETVEIFLDDTKTGGDKGGSRFVTMLGMTRVSKITVADDLRELWRVQGTPVIKTKELGFDVERPDYWVARVSLIDMSQARAQLICNELDRAPEPVALLAASTRAAIKRKMKASTTGEEEKYVNIAGGRRKGPEVLAASNWMEQLGLGRFCDVVAGPLIRAPTGYIITHNALMTTSADNHIREALDNAYASLKESGVHDPELDVPPDCEPKWGQHSFRRQSDRVAQETKKRSGVSADDIDFFFGWNLKELLARMQLHYKGLDRMARLGLALVTAWM